MVLLYVVSAVDYAYVVRVGIVRCDLVLESRGYRSGGGCFAWRPSRAGEHNCRNAESGRAGVHLFSGGNAVVYLSPHNPGHKQCHSLPCVIWRVSLVAHVEMLLPMG